MQLLEYLATFKSRAFKCKQIGANNFTQYLLQNSKSAIHVLVLLSV